MLDNLHSDPVILVSNLTDDHLVEPLQAAMLLDRQHPIVPHLELVAIGLGQLQLRLLLFVQTLVVLNVGRRLL